MAKRKNGKALKKSIVKEEPKVEKKVEKVEKVVVNEPKSNWVGTEDLYIVEGNNKIDTAHQFKSQISGIYGVKEYFWKELFTRDSSSLSVLVEKLFLFPQILTTVIPWSEKQKI